METTRINLELRKFVAPEYIFGENARLLAVNFCRQYGARKILLVSDSGVANTPWLHELEQSFIADGMEYICYTSVSPNPRDYEVMQGAERYQSEQCNLIVALGGGSVLDCAKGIGIAATNHADIRSFEGVDNISRPMPPLICIPTTAGSAADVSQFAIINNTSERYKMAIISKAVVPDVALIDPLVLTSMSGFLTACTGIDALAHAIEAYVSNASSHTTDMYALEAIRLVTNNLHLSIQKPHEIQYRAGMMLASLYAGLAFSNASLGCVHSLAHSLGGYLDLPHGECNAILLPHVVEYNYPKAEERYNRIAEIIGAPVAGQPSSSVKTILMNHLIDLKESLGVHATLAERKVRSSDLPILSENAIKDPCNATNPRPPIKSDLETIYKEAM